MDGTSDRSTFPTEDVPPCFLDDEPTRRRFPKGELCVAGSVVCGFFVVTGLTMVTLHYTVESREGFHSLSKHLHIQTHVLGLSLVVLAGFIVLILLIVYAVWKVMRVVEMAHRYEEHREFCAYEDLRQSFRSQQSQLSGRCVVDVSRHSTAGSKDTPRKGH